jgi:hypothetical protein
VQAYPYAQPAYPYPPPVDPAQRNAVLGELANVDAQIASVQAARARFGLGGPIAMMATGYGTALVFSIVSLVQWSIAEDIEHQRFFDSEWPSAAACVSRAAWPRGASSTPSWRGCARGACSC